MEGVDPERYDEILSLVRRGSSAVIAAAAGCRAVKDKYAELKKCAFPKRSADEGPAHAPFNEEHVVNQLYAS